MDGNTIGLFLRQPIIVSPGIELHNCLNCGKELKSSYKGFFKKCTNPLCGQQHSQLIATKFSKIQSVSGGIHAH